MTSPDPGLVLAHQIAASVTWAQIGARDGKTGKIAKRDAKRLARKMSRAARLQENATREVVLHGRLRLPLTLGVPPTTASPPNALAVPMSTLSGS